MPDHARIALTSEADRKLRIVSTATITSQLLSRGFRNTFMPALRPSRPDLRMVGHAYTLRYAPAREDIGIAVAYDNNTNIQRLAVESLSDGDVLVIDARGEINAASIGEILANRARARGAAGIVTDGCLRDTPGFGSLDLPVDFRASHATTSSILHHPVDQNVPIGCAGVLVLPGDVIVGDAEGVVVIPAALAEELAHDAYEQHVLEEFALSLVREGESIRGVYPIEAHRMEQFNSWRRSLDI